MISWCLVPNVVSLCVAGVVCAVVLIAAPGPARAAMEGVEYVELEGVFCWPTTLPDGRLFMSWTEGKTERKEDIANTEIVQKAFARYSADNGRTWSEPQLLFEFPKGEGLRGTDISLCDRDGVIHLFGLHYFFWSWEKYAGKSLVHHVMSADGGKTWAAPQYCDFGHQYSGGATSALQLSTGRILLPIGYASEPPQVRGWGTVFSLSDDGGKTWRMGQEPIFVAGKSLDEAAGVELNDGRVWMLFRTDEGYLYESYSTDGGETWSEPQPSRFVSPSAPSGTLRLSDGRIIVSWNNSLKPSHVVNRLVLAAAISDDDGQTWRGYREIARCDSTDPPMAWMTYPGMTEAADGAVIAKFHSAGKPYMVRLDPDWLMETSFRDDFSQGPDNWITIRTEGVTVVPHPKHPERQVLRVRKPNPEVAAGASLNFPFGARGEMRIRLLLQDGFQGARICLTDHFTYPYYAEDGQFGISIGADGQIGVGTGESDFTPTDVTLETRTWYTLGFVWDCAKGSCGLSVDGEHIADLPQLSPAVGVCYLRLWLAAEETDRAGLVVDSVSVSVS